MKNEDIVRKINPELVREDGRLKPFAEQLLEYEYGIYPEDKPFVISNTTIRLNNADIMPLPITINQSTINKIKKKHDISNSFIMRIEGMLRNNVLIIKSRNKHTKNSLVVVTDCLDKQDRPIVIILRKDYLIGYKRTNNISSMYGRSNMEKFLEASFRDGCEFYPNEKTEHWLSSQRLQLSPDVASALLYNYNISNDLYCQAENLYSRNNRSKDKKNSSLDEQIFYAKSRSSKKREQKDREDYELL